jgi:hypothetical protein
MCPGLYETFFLTAPFGLLAGFVTGAGIVLALVVKYWDS